MKLAFEFLVLTAARSDEVRLATRDEMDLDAAAWLVPGARLKAKRDHRVPLSGRALAILRDSQSLGDGTSLVFPSPRGKPLSDMTLSKLVKELGLPVGGGVEPAVRASGRARCGRGRRLSDHQEGLCGNRDVGPDAT